MRFGIITEFMDPGEIIKAAPDVAKLVGPVAVAIPFTGIIKRMLGPAADELAEVWKDQVRLYRYGRQMQCIEKAEKMAKQAGFPPSAVPLKVLFPLLDGAALEEDETLSTMWAALLANAADPKNTEHVRPSFVEALKHLSRSEALLLNGLYDVSRREYQKLYVDNLDLAERGQVSSARQLSDPSSRFIDFVVGAGDVVAPTNMDLREEVWTAMGNETMVDRNEPSWTQYTICMDTLLMERLIEIRAGGGLVFTSRGLEFLAMCRTPSKADSR